MSVLRRLSSLPRLCHTRSSRHRSLHAPSASSFYPRGWSPQSLNRTERGESSPKIEEDNLVPPVQKSEPRRRKKTRVERSETLAKWERYVQGAMMRRFSVEDGIESLQKQAHAPFGSIRFDEMNKPKIDGQDSLYEEIILRHEEAKEGFDLPGDELVSGAVRSGQVTDLRESLNPTLLSSTPRSMSSSAFFEETPETTAFESPEVTKASKMRLKRKTQAFSYKPGAPGKLAPSTSQEEQQTMAPQFDFVKHELEKMTRADMKRNLSNVPVLLDQDLESDFNSTKIKSDFNAVDEYFSGSSEFEQESLVDKKSPKKASDGAEIDVTRETLNSVDEQYFAGVTDKLSTDYFSRIPTDTEETARVRELVSSSTKDLGYVDSQIYFQQVGSTLPKARMKSDENIRSFPDLSPVELEDQSIALPKKRKRNKAERPVMQSNESVTNPDSALAYVTQLRAKQSSLERPKVKSKEELLSDLGVGIAKKLSLVDSSSSAMEALEEVTAKKGGNENDGVKYELTRLKNRFKPSKLYDLTSDEVMDMLVRRIAYDDNDILAVNKPYGLPMFGDDVHTVEKYLPWLAQKTNTGYLYEVHRLDKTTSGVMLLAKTKTMRDKLKDLFRRRQIDKRYWAIVRGEPLSKEGIISITLCEGVLPDGRRRITVQPDYSGVQSEELYGNKQKRLHRSLRKVDFFPAVTEYKVLKTNVNTSLLEVKPITGFKHQVRAHLGLGLGCPILGDHKYSHIVDIGKPQKLSGETLHKLRLRQSKTRELPILLHAKHLQIPEIIAGRQIWVDASLPPYFNAILHRLKLNPDERRSI